MRITTKIIMALALATAGLGYFQFVAASDRIAGVRSVAVTTGNAETMRTASERERTPVYASAHR